MPTPPRKIISESLALMTTAFGLVAALAWNEAIKTLIAEVVPRGQGVMSLFIYAIVVTAVAVVISMRLLNIKERIDSPHGGEEYQE